MTEIRSYRRVWDLERRIYRVDRLRLNPGGIPVRGVCYLIATLGAVLLARRLPLVGTVLARVPWYLLDAALPVALATLLGAISIEGRPFHLAAVGMLRFRAENLARRRTEPCRWSPEPVHVLVDGSGHELRTVRYDGPGAVAIEAAHEIAERRPRMRARGVRTCVELTEVEQRGKRPQRELLWLAPGARLHVRAAKRSSRRA